MISFVEAMDGIGIIDESGGGIEIFLLGKLWGNVSGNLGLFGTLNERGIQFKIPQFRFDTFDEMLILLRSK
jgi:hypothetical protein